MKYLYSNMTEEKFNICKNKDKYRRVIFAIAFLHSLLNGRKLFGPYGWNMEYNFLNNDFEVSKFIPLVKSRRLLIFLVFFYSYAKHLRPNIWMNIPRHHGMY